MGKANTSGSALASAHAFEDVGDERAVRCQALGYELPDTASLKEDPGNALAVNIADSYSVHLEVDSNLRGRNYSDQENAAPVGYRGHYTGGHDHLAVSNCLWPVRRPLQGYRNRYVENGKNHVLDDWLGGQLACLVGYSTVSAVAA